MQRPVLLGLCVIVCLACWSDGSEYCMNSDSAPFRLYAEKTAYDEARGQSAAQNETIPGCETIHMYMVSRHGSRYNDVTSHAQMRDELLPLRDIVVNSTNELCEEDRDLLRSWLPLYDPNEDTTLAPRGWREFNEIGERYTTRVPGLLARPYNSDAYHFQHTDYSRKGYRTSDSARAFVQGVWGSYALFSDNIDLEQSVEPDWLIRFYANCEKYLTEVRTQPVEEHDEFSAGPVMKAVLRRMESRLGLVNMSLALDVADLIYESCRVEYLVQDGVAPWCVALTPEDAAVFEYRKDLTYYWQMSYPHDINYQQACPLVADMVNNIKDAIDNDGKLVTALFGHHPTMTTFFTLLGLYRDPEPLTASNYKDMSDRKWRVSEISPMGSNAAFIAYKCQTEPVYRLKTLINEKPTTLPQCQDAVCDLDDVMKVWRPIADNCDVEELCTLDDDDVSDSGDAVRCISISYAFVILVIGIFIFERIRC